MNILKSKKEIQKLFESGKTISNGFFLFKFIESESSNFLFAVSSKKFPRAVDRNRIKRLMKEVVREVIIKNKSIAIIYTGTSVPEFKEVDNSIKNLIKKI